MSTHCKASLPVLSHAMQRLQCCVIWKKILMVFMVGILQLRSGTFPNCQLSSPIRYACFKLEFYLQELHQPQAAASGLVSRHQRRLVNVLAQRLPADMLSSYSHGLQPNTVCFNNDKASLLRDVNWNFWLIGCDQWRSQKYFLSGGNRGEIIVHMGVAISRNMKYLLTVFFCFVFLHYYSNCYSSCSYLLSVFSGTL